MSVERWVTMALARLPLPAAATYTATLLLTVHHNGDWQRHYREVQLQVPVLITTVLPAVLTAAPTTGYSFVKWPDNTTAQVFDFYCFSTATYTANIRH